MWPQLLGACGFVEDDGERYRRHSHDENMHSADRATKHDSGPVIRRRPLLDHYAEQREVEEDAEADANRAADERDHQIYDSRGRRHGFRWFTHRSLPLSCVCAHAW